jgi:tripartite-type tricarboxylate transporter receptor subunit TctC
MKKFLVLAMLLAAGLAHANSFEFVVKGAAGGPDDVLVRKVIQQLEKDTNLKIAAINKPGASHIIAYNYFESKTTPMLILGDKNMAKHPVAASSQRLFAVGDLTNIMFVKNGSNIRSFDDLVKLSKEREIKFGHGGVGTLSWEAADLTCQKIMKCLLVPYRAGALAMLDILTDTIDVYALASYGSNSFLGNDQYRAIMTYSTQKHPNIDVPVLPKKYQDIEMRNWIAVYGRNLTAKDQDTIQRALNNIDPAFFIEMGLYK